jgi:hypothetical protein
LVQPQFISTATLDGKIYDEHNYQSTDVFSIDSVLSIVQSTYERAKEARRRFGSRSTLYSINDATNQLNLALKKKKDLIAKKKLVMI